MKIEIPRTFQGFLWSKTRVHRTVRTVYIELSERFILSEQSEHRTGRTVNFERTVRTDRTPHLERTVRTGRTVRTATVRTLVDPAQMR